MDLKKQVKIIIFSILLIIVSFPITTFAQDGGFNEEAFDNFSKYYYQSGAEELFSSLNEETKDILKDNNLDVKNPTSLLSLNVIDVIKSLFTLSMKSFFDVKVILFTIIGVILFASIMDALKNTFNSGQYENIFNTVTVLAVSGILMPVVTKIIDTVVINVETTSKFVLGFIPVYSSIIVATGKPLTAITYNSVLFTVMQIIVMVTNNILIPLLTIYLAFNIICSAVNVINIENISTTIKKTVVFALSFCMTMFIALLSLQSFVANSIDTLGFKATKLAIGTFVPVVGGAIGDALNSVYGSIGVLKSTLGSFSIIVVILNFLPIIFNLIAMMFILNLGSIVADVMQVSKVSSLLKSVGQVITLMFSILLCIMVMVILSTALMITVAN